MFVAYVDESGSDDANDYIGVGGLIAPIEHWKAFEGRWREILAQHGVPYSHMREFAHSTGAFRKWRSPNKQFEPERIKFSADICQCILDHAIYSFGAIITKRHWKTLVPEDMRKDMGGPYAFLGRYCMTRICVWADDNGQTEPVDLVFEKGQPESAIRLQHSVLCRNENVRKEYRLGNLRFEDKRGVLPLQAADVVAYELLKHFNDLASGRTTDLRHPLRRLREMPNAWNKLTSLNIGREVAVWRTVREYARRSRI
jgi:hypothetical protein